MADPNDKDKTRAADLAGYLAEFTSGKGRMEADCILENLQAVRADERARIVTALRADLDAFSGYAGDIADAIEGGRL